MQAERPIRSREDLRVLSDVVAAEIAAGRIAEENLEAFAEYYPTPFADVRQGKLEDIVFCLFHCTRCGQKYSLTCETYHGRGGRWSPFEPRKAR
jgi:hypothetical protein